MECDEEDIGSGCFPVKEAILQYNGKWNQQMGTLGRGDEIKYACLFYLYSKFIVALLPRWVDPIMVHGKAEKSDEKAAKSFHLIDLRYLVPGGKDI